MRLRNPLRRERHRRSPTRTSIAPGPSASSRRSSDHHRGDSSRHARGGDTAGGWSEKRRTGRRSPRASRGSELFAQPDDILVSALVVAASLPERPVSLSSPSKLSTDLSRKRLPYRGSRRRVAAPTRTRADAPRYGFDWITLRELRSAVAAAETFAEDNSVNALRDPFKRRVACVESCRKRRLPSKRACATASASSWTRDRPTTGSSPADRPSGRLG